MATFTEAQVADLAEVFAVNSNALAAQLNLFASLITESDKTKALGLITKWQELDADDNGTTFTAVTTNLGFNQDITIRKNEIRRTLANMLGCDDLLGGGSGGVNFNVYS
jgi:hypothetical protein